MMDNMILQNEEQLKQYQEWENNEEIQIFREYLRFATVHPNIDYEPCADFLVRLGHSLGLHTQIFCPVTKAKPIVIMTMLGTQPDLKSIILNSHMDVVPVFEEYWTHKPFEADMDAEGRIFARGSQDMKCVGMQYLGALRYFIKKSVAFKRSIHVMFVPEEELGGDGGMADFIHTVDFRRLNAGFSLDEGIASPNDVFNVFYAERCIWHIIFKISGTPGHGSLLVRDTAGEKLTILLNKLFTYRDTQVRKLESNPELTIGDVTTVNVTMVNGGAQSNVLPPEISVMTDFRLSIDIDHEAFEAMVRRWCEETGDVDYEWDLKDPFIAPSNIDDTNEYWVAFKAAFADLDLKYKVQVFPGGTDSRYIRSVGIPAIGFSPMVNTPVLLHDHDEFLQADVYLNGIEIYKSVIERVANA